VVYQHSRRLLGAFSRTRCLRGPAHLATGPADASNAHEYVRIFADPLRDTFVCKDAIAAQRTRQISSGASEINLSDSANSNELSNAVPCSLRAAVLVPGAWVLQLRRRRFGPRCRNRASKCDAGNWTVAAHGRRSRHKRAGRLSNVFTTSKRDLRPH
jgi:hypothetical protein